MSKYNHLNIPKVKYNFPEKSTAAIIENLKSGTLSEDAMNVGFYILEYDRQVKRNVLDQIRLEISESSDYELFKSFHLNVIEQNESLTLEFKKTNKSFQIALLSVLSMLYVFIILPFSITRILNHDYLYLFGPLIFLFPYLIYQSYESFNQGNNFYLNLDQENFTIKSKGTTFEKFVTKKEKISDLEIVESSDYEYKLIVKFKDRNRIEILSEQYSNLSKEKIMLYLTKVKKNIRKTG